ncbi:hypothetical protein H0H92_009805 [Tricholoma furcatifolium]|nr:hypothetical protein H0H92_009805 [Tricholoma furcatifolium]
MPPRSVNPHFLPVSSIPVSRNKIYSEHEDSDEEIPLDADPQLVNRLKELISIDWDWQHENRSAKRRRIRSPSHSEEDRAISFRLVSISQPPYPISLRPKTPPPPITREPEVEDNEAQALLRAERAKAAAIDAAVIIAESYQSTPVSSESLSCT